jgi:GrpB-like predicted nucleotidyltransferase (UPF0157 family)
MISAELAVLLAEAGIDITGPFDPASAFAALRRRHPAAATLDVRFALEAASLGVDTITGTERRRAMEDYYRHQWPGFEMVGDADRNDPIVVVDYGPSWPERFTRWRWLIADMLGEVAGRIEHVGSTAVPGLAAKPIIDIQVGVEDLDDEPSYVPGLERLGLGLRSRDTHHRYFRPPPPRPRDAQVHVCRTGGPWERDHLLFRNHLVAHPDLRDRYAALKRDLALRYRHDRLAYTEGKSEFIDKVMRAAVVEATSNES